MALIAEKKIKIPSLIRPAILVFVWIAISKQNKLSGREEICTSYFILCAMHAYPIS